MHSFHFLLLMSFFSLTASEVLPSTSRTCVFGGDVNNATQRRMVRVYETELPSQQIDDSQIFFLEIGNNKVDAEIIFLRTIEGRIMKSTDEGMSWEEQSVPAKMGNNIQSQKIKTIIPAGEKGNHVVYFLGENTNSFWMTSDYGETYTYHSGLPSGTLKLIPHPVTPSQIFLALRQNPANSNRRELWLGNPTISKWDKIDLELPSYTQVAWSPFVGTHINRIYVIVDNGNSGVFDGQILYSDDFFSTTAASLPTPKGVYKWYMFSPHTFVVAICATTNAACDTKELQISEDSGSTFVAALFPDYRTDTLEEEDFHIFELADNTIWVHVSRSCEGQFCWGDMFHSYSADEKFTLSLPHQRQSDFTKYNSVNGIYVANQYDTKGENRHPVATDSVRSLITFNKGSEWNLIRAPTIDAFGNLTNCSWEDGCGLHIHGWQTRETYFTYFYSVPNAIGLMLATGNIGTKLNNNINEINTYISFNGGVSWSELRKGPWVSEIGDHGSIITLLKQLEDTNEIIYTINDGETWSTCEFSDKPMDVINVRVSEGWDSRKFLVYGKRIDQGGAKAVVVQVNFDDVFSGRCVFPDDYTQWSPTDEHGHCVMGGAVIYMRRQQGKDCFFGEDHEHTYSTKSCNCTVDDYDCDHCFYRPDLSSLCTLECLVPDLPLKPEFCVNSTKENQLYYEVNMGYRLIEGDSCNTTFGSPPPFGRIPCKFGEDVSIVPPGNSNGDGSGSFYETFIFALLIGGSVVGIVVVLFGVFWKTHPNFQICIKEMIGINTLRYDTVGDREDLDGDDIQMEVESDDE